MGSADFAVPSLVTLLSSGYEIPLVFSQPDRKAGRGGNVKKTPVTQAAVDAGIEVYQPLTLKDPEALDMLRKAQPDLCVIIAYGLKVPPEMLAVPKYGFINAHASILPKYRGAAPVAHAILNGEKETGVTIFKLEEQWDTGPVYGYINTPIRNNDTNISVLERLSIMAAEKILEVVDSIKNGNISPVAQNHAEATKAPKFTRDDGHIDWKKPASEIDCMVRALQPWPAAFTEFPGKRGAVQRVNILHVEEEQHRDLTGIEIFAGKVIEADPKLGIVVLTGHGEALRLTRIKPEGKREMTGAEYVRGSNLALDTILS